MRTHNRSDPFHNFEVEQQSCILLHVKVLHGRNISQGWMADWLHAPCPFMLLNVPNAPEGLKRTRHIENEKNPQWNENFTFYLDPKREHILNLILMNNHWCGGEIGHMSIHCAELVMDVRERRTLHFHGTSEVEIELMAEFDKNPTLRYSLCLPEEEKNFREHRQDRVFQSLKRLLGERAPDSVDQVPTMAVIGSGGGFRAMVGFAGAFRALTESGVMDCATYTAALSGSSWYLSQLYSHPKWPQGNVAEVNAELRTNINRSFLWLLKPSSSLHYVDKILAKRAAGLPVSFTDFFGYLVGDTIMKGRMTSRLSDQTKVVKKGAAPLPLYTCVHVKKDVSARVFQEWVEFTPYEIGLPKYGIFFNTSLFGSKFFMGKVIKQFPEPPLHYLQGIWGSAFCILFKRLLDKCGKSSQAISVRSEKKKELDHRAAKRKPAAPRTGKADATNRKRSASTSVSSCGAKRRKGNDGGIEKKNSGGIQGGSSYLGNILEKMCTSSRLSLLSSREARAGVTHNPLRGLTLQRTFAFSPFTQTQTPISAKDEFNSIFDLHPTSEKYQYLVDAGLTFNSPYPLVLRPQRTVDVIISYDFSARPSDLHHPFKELLFAAKWARLNKVPFPPVDVKVWNPEDPKEVYVFQHPTDPRCPVIIHFVLINASFRDCKEPGVKRQTEEEKKFADFSLFDDPASPYSTFYFKYSHEAFDRLSSLIEYNTWRHLGLIKDVLAESVVRKGQHGSVLPVSKPFQLLPMTNVKSCYQRKRSLRQNLTNAQSRGCD